jgi:hypothetical protein
MKIYLINKLIDNCAYETIFCFSSRKRAEIRLKWLDNKDNWFIYKIEEMEVL